MTSLESWGGRAAGGWRELLGLGAAEFYDEIGSTNDRALELAAQVGPLPALVCANRQRRGRGRRGRRWQSSSDLGLWVSVLARGSAPGSALSLIAGLAVAGALDDLASGRLHTELAWPNDLLAGGRKLGGILCEAARRDRVVVGLGLNLNHGWTDSPMPGSKRAVSDRPATSFKIETGRGVPREEALRSIAPKLIDAVRGGGRLLTSAERKEWKERGAMLGRECLVYGAVQNGAGLTRKARSIRCRPLGVRSDGALLVEELSGRRRLAVVAGSARPLEESA